ncbi:carboxymuconolactone decarboxylase family protein [Lutibacter sp.]|uniref:carboxymuconolactone decarboxylase family protein n=1 Tax=Lutibacter sp. TaxID=1925666 RepID=UPI003563AA08
MLKDYCKSYNDLEKSLQELELVMPETMKKFKNLQRETIDVGALNLKTKELIALGIAISLKCNGGITLHINEALKAGNSFSEILETIGVAVYMGGESAVIYGCEALEALNQFIVLENE